MTAPSVSHRDRIRPAVVLWTLAAVAAVLSLPAPFLVPLGMFGFPPAIYVFTFLSVGLGALGFSFAREAGLKASFYIPVLVGLAAIVPTGALYSTIFMFPPATACLGSQAYCAPFIVAHVFAVLAVGFLTAGALVWLRFRVHRTVDRPAEVP